MQINPVLDLEYQWSLSNMAACWIISYVFVCRVFSLGVDYRYSML